MRVIAPTATVELQRLAEERQDCVAAAQIRSRATWSGALLAFAVTNDPAVNEAVVAAARERRVLVDDTGDGEHSDFATPALHRSGPVTISVDTGGASPAFAALVRDAIAGTIDERYGKAAPARSPRPASTPQTTLAPRRARAR